MPKWTCLECHATQVTRLLKPKGWVKRKGLNGVGTVFCSKNCMKKWYGES